MAPACNPRIWEAEAGRSLEVGSLDQPGQHGETPSLLKIHKISQVCWHAPVIPASGEAEVGGSLEHTTAFQPVRQSEPLSQKKTRIQKEEQEDGIQF